MLSPQGNLRMPKAILRKIWLENCWFRICLYTAAQALFRYDISRIIQVSSGGFIVKVTIGFILSRSATNWIFRSTFSCSMTHMELK